MNKIWKTLSEVNVNNDKERKGRFDYLSWADAWKHVQQNTEDATYQLHDDVVYPDNSREVRCSVTIDGVTHMMWLAVMDNTNRAIKNPDARAINDARMRCLVKAIAMHGLGLYIYAGEDLPDVNPTATKPLPNTKKSPQNPDVSVQPLEPEEPQTTDMKPWQAYYHNGQQAGPAYDKSEDYRERLIGLFRKYQTDGRSQAQLDQLWQANFNLIDQLGENDMMQVQAKFEAQKKMAKQ
jgi:hypothetical protein